MLTDVLKSIGHIFTKLPALVYFWDKDECFKFWSQKVKTQGHSGSSMQENALFSLVS